MTLGGINNTQVVMTELIIIVLEIITISLFHHVAVQVQNCEGGPCASLMDDCVRSRIVPFRFPAYHHHSRRCHHHHCHPHRRHHYQNVEMTVQGLSGFTFATASN